MNVFFSAEDISELNDVAPLYLYYVSMIVNNKSEMTCKIAFLGDTDSRVIYNTSLNQSDTRPVPIQLVKEKKLITVDCEIVGETITGIDSKYKNRLNSILNSKVKIIPPVTKFPVNAIPPSNWKPLPKKTSGTITTFDNTLFSNIIEFSTVDIVDFIATLLQEDDTLNLDQIFDNLVKDKSIKAGEIVTSVEDEFEEAAALIFGEIDNNDYVRLIEDATKMINTSSLKDKPKVKAIITGLNNYLFNLKNKQQVSW